MTNVRIARIFFDGGLIETRPLAWIRFYRSELPYETDIDKLIAMHTANLEDQSQELFFVDLGKVTAMQVFTGNFVVTRGN